jgi:hypothetical protein
MRGRMVRWVVPVVVAIAASVSVAPPVSAGTGPEPLECDGSTTSQNVPVEVDVVLTHDLTCPHGFYVPFAIDHPVTIDLRGHTLTVPGATCGPPGTCIGLDNFTEVANGRLVASISNATSVHHIWVDGQVWMSSSSGSDAPSSLTHSVVTGQVRHFGGVGGVIDSNILTGGVAVANDLRVLEGIQVTRNWVVASPGAGISVQDNLPSYVSGTVSHNIVWRSAGSGIEIGGSLFLAGAVDVESNLVVRNGGDGIRVLQTGPAFYPPGVAPGPVTLRDNVALGNDGHGIDASWSTLTTETGIVDGGRNRALFNGTPPGCIAVSCRW